MYDVKVYIPVQETCRDQRKEFVMANDRRRSGNRTRTNADRAERTRRRRRRQDDGAPGNDPRLKGQAPSGRRKGRRRRRKGWSIGKKIAVTLMLVLILLVTAAIVVVASKWGKISTGTLNIGKLNISQEAKASGTGYLNVALFGLDSRDADPDMGSRSDTIIIASLNRETKEIKMTSVYRDTLLEIPGEDDEYSYNKANAAYAYGGAEDAVAMLNRNLDLDIEKYVTVDFSALVDVIDALGGIDIDVKEEEIPQLNNYVVEIIENIGQDSAPVTEAGTQHLNGIQATAYARIRYVGNDDYERTERQRRVLEQVALKAQKAKLSTLNSIIDKVFDKVETNFTLTEVIAYAKDVKDYVMGDTTGFPYELTTQLLDVGDSIIATDLEQDVIKLHQFLFGDEDYTPSSTVKSISRTISNESYNTGQSYDTESEYSDYPIQDYGYTDYGSSDYSGSYNNSSQYDNGSSGNDAYGTGGTDNGYIDQGTGGTGYDDGSGTGDGTGGGYGDGTDSGTGTAGTGGTGSTGWGTDGGYDSYPDGGTSGGGSSYLD